MHIYVHILIYWHIWAYTCIFHCIFWHIFALSIRKSIFLHIFAYFVCIFGHISTCLAYFLPYLCILFAYLCILSPCWVHIFTYIFIFMLHILAYIYIERAYLNIYISCSLAVSCCACSKLSIVWCSSDAGIFWRAIRFQCQTRWWLWTFAGIICCHAVSIPTFASPVTKKVSWIYQWLSSQKWTETHILNLASPSCLNLYRIAKDNQHCWLRKAHSWRNE